MYDGIVNNAITQNVKSNNKCKYQQFNAIYIVSNEGHRNQQVRFTRQMNRCLQINNEKITSDRMKSSKALYDCCVDYLS